MIINDLTIKYTLANNWILRTDPYYESRKYSVYDITSRLTLYVTRSCYTLLKIFHDKALSFSSLYEAIEQKNIKIDWEGPGSIPLTKMAASTPMPVSRIRFRA